MKVKNEKAINDFKKRLRFENKSINTIRQNSNVLKTLSRYIKKDFKKATEKDIIGYLSKYQVSTRATRLAIIRKFYRFIFNMDKKELPDCLKRIEFPKIKTDDISYRERVISPNEYQILINYCKNPMEKAIMETLYNFGIRRGEILAIKIKDVRYDGISTTITVRESKTKTRDVEFQGRSKYLLEWVESYHPFKDEKELPVFFNKDKTVKYESNGIYQMIRRKTKQAGIRRRITPHDFRHTAITRARGEGIPETFIELNFGLVHGSTQMRVYDHNRNKDFKDYLKKRNQGVDETFEQVKEKKEILEKKHEREIEDLKKTMQKVLEFIDKNDDSNIYEYIDGMKSRIELEEKLS